MAKITKSSIFVDSKKLLQYTYTIYNMLSNKNKAQIGNHLLDANLKMIEHFSLAYHKRDNQYELLTPKGTYTLSLKGLKKNELTALFAQYERYKILLEFIFSSVELSHKQNALSDKQRDKLYVQFLEHLAKIEAAIQKWDQSIKQNISIEK